LAAFLPGCPRLFNWDDLHQMETHLPALASKFLGKSFSHVVNFFTVLLLLVWNVFISAPASMIDDLIGKDLNMFTLIVLAIFAYYIIATVLPIDKIIGKIYLFLDFIIERHRCCIWDVYVW
jgi:carbon starvation protein CstA